MAPSDGQQELMTLGKGKRAKAFRWRTDGDGITIHAGSQAHLSNGQIEQILSHFRDSRWFPLGVSMTSPADGGLGQYVKVVNGLPTPRYASHFAAVLVQQNRLACRDEGNAVYLKVV